MSRTIDEKIVEMQFDNSDFEKNVKTSMSTLDKLKQSLQFDDTGKSLKKAFDSINFASVVSGIQNLEKRFSTLGIVGMRIIENLTDYAMKKVSSVIQAAYNAVITGGKNRAFNIENARFMLQGLLADEKEVAAVMDDAMQSVTDTAYGYDEAAKAAAMFAASGLHSGKEMLTALRGIAGIAATTNSEYQGVADIFTTIAGNGKVMAMQLNQFATRGLNAAATLAKFFTGVNNGSIEVEDSVKAMVQEITKSTEVSEADIREFVHDGEISFQVFAAAMDSSFGEHAKKANETFTGALANIRAALSRIGADFVSPLIGQNGVFVRFFNVIRKQIDNVRKELKPVAEVFTNWVSSKIAGWTGYISKVDFSNFFKAFRNIVDLLVGVDRIISNFNSTMWNAFIDAIPAMTSFTDKLSSIGKNLFLTQRNADRLKSIFDSIFGDIIGSLSNVADVVKEFLPRVTLDGFIEFLTIIKDIIHYFRIGEVETSNLKKIFEGFFALLDIGKQILDVIVQGIMALSSPVAKASDFIWNLAGNIADFIVAFDQWLKRNDIFARGAKNIVGAFKMFIDKFKEFSTAANNKVFEWTGNDIKDLFNIIATYAGKAWKALKDFFNIFKEFFELDREEFSNGHGFLYNKFAIWLDEDFGVNLDEKAEKIKQKFQKIKDSFKKFKEEVVGFFNDSGLMGVFKTLGKLLSDAWTIIGDGLMEFNKINFNNIDYSGLENFGATMQKILKPIVALLTIVERAFEGFLNFIRAIFPIFSVLFKFLADLFKQLAGEIFGAVKDLDAKKIIEWLNVALLLKIIRKIKIKTNNILKSVSLFASKGAQLVDTVNKVLEAAKSGLFAITKAIKGSALKRIAISIAILTAALYALSKLDHTSLAITLGVVASQFGMLFTTTKKFADLEKKLDDLESVEKVVDIAMAMSAAVLMLSIAMRLVGKMDAKQIGVSLLAIGALVLMMYEFIKMISKNELEFKEGMSGLIGLASAALILAMSVKKLSKLDPEKMMQGLLGVGLLILELAAFIKLIGGNDPKNPGKNLIEVGAGMLIFAVAVRVLVASVKKLSKLDPEAMFQGVLGVTMLLAALAAFFKTLESPEKMISFASGMLILATSLTIIAAVVRILGAMELEKMMNGLMGLAGAMGILVVSIGALSYITKTLKTSAASIVAISAAFMIFAVSMTVMAGAIKILSTIDTDLLTNALFAMAGALLGFVGAVVAVEEFSNAGSAAAVAGAIATFAAAMLLMAPAFKIMGSMQWESITKAIVLLGSAIIIFAVASKAMAPTVTTLLIFSQAIALLGLAMAGVGAGILMLALGLQILAGSAATFAEMLTTILTSVLLFIPQMILAIGQGILEMITRFGTAILKECIHAVNDLLPELIELVMNTIDALMKSLKDHLPSIASNLVDLLIGLCDALTGKAYDIVNRILILVLDIIAGVGQALKENASKIVDVLVEFLCNVLLAAVSMVFPWLIDWITGGVDDVVQIVDVLSDKQKELIGRIDAMSQAYYSLMSSRNQNLSDVNNEFGYIENLKNEYNSLIDSNGKVKTGYEERAETILTTLAQATGIELDQIKSLIDENGKLSESFDEVIKKMKAEAYISANKEAYETAIKNQAEAKRLMVEANNEWTDAQALYLEAYEARSQAASQVAELYAQGNYDAAEEIQNRIDNELTPAVNRYGSAAYEMKLKFQEMEDTYVGYSQEILNTQNLMYAAEQGHLEELDQYMDNLNYSLITAATGTQRTLEKQEEQFRKNLANTKEAYAKGLEGVTQADIDFWYDMVSRASSETQKYKLGIREGFSGVGTEATNTISTDIKNGTGDVKDASEGVKDAVTEPLSTLPEELQGIDLSMLEQAGIDMDQLTSIYNTGGMDSVNALIGSISDGEEDAEKAGDALADSTANGASSLSGSMKTNAQNGVDSLCNTTTSKANLNKAYNSGAALANAKNQGYKDADQQHSPSRVMRKLANMSVMGLILGLEEFKDKVYDSSADLAETSYDAMSTVLSNVSDILSADLEDNPTITPMLDLSNITAGADTINSLLNGNRMLKVSSAANGASTSAWARNNQNGIEVNNKDVVGVINQLREDVTDLNSKVGNLQVVMDTGALVGQISQPINNRLGRQAIRRGRGV